MKNKKTKNNYKLSDISPSTENRSFANLSGSVVARKGLGSCDLTISCGNELLPPALGGIH